MKWVLQTNGAERDVIYTSVYWLRNELDKTRDICTEHIINRNMRPTK